MKLKEEIDREKEKKEQMKLRDREERQKKREKEKEEKEKMKEKEKEEKYKREEKNKREREEKEKKKQMEKENKLKLKEEKEKNKQREREEREKEKKREKEEKERQKQKLREERKLYNERFQNLARVRINQRNNSPFYQHSSNNRPYQPQGGYYQRLTYNSNKLYQRKRRHSHKRIQPKNRIPRLDPKKNLGKTALKIIKPKRYDDDESESEPIDFEEKLMKFPRFRAKYGKNYVLKNKNKYLNSYLAKESEKMGATKKTNLTISEADEEEEKNYKFKNLKKGKLGQIKPKGKFNMDKKMREILGKQYKILLDDPLNPYSTCWPSNFLKAGYDTGFEYDNFQSGVPVLKLRSLGKKQLPPIKKKGLHFDNNPNSPQRNSKNQNLYPGTSSKKNNTGENFDYKTNKSDTYQFNNRINDKEEDFGRLNGITEENEK